MLWKKKAELGFRVFSESGSNFFINNYLLLPYNEEQNPQCIVHQANNAQY